ncbi:EspF repeat-containing protein [Sphingobium sp.]|uniref:EspF repeat-containing protein n=1 Tax=Sphingobium sp. TaxID=1912891 RepID=UPI0039C95A2B
MCGLVALYRRRGAGHVDPSPGWRVGGCPAGNRRGCRPLAEVAERLAQSDHPHFSVITIRTVEAR